jgi:hypothetical protein
MPDPQPDPFDAALAHLSQVQAADQQPQTPGPTAGARVADVVDSANSGIGKSVHETVKAGIQIGEALDPATIVSNAVNYYTGANIPVGEVGKALEDANQSVAEFDGSTYRPKTTTGGVTQGVSQFVAGFIGAGKFMKGVEGFEALPTILKGFSQGAVADAMAFDPKQDRLSNLFNDFAENHPSLRNPLTDFLAAKENDLDAEGRLKNAMEGVVAGGAIEGVLRTFRAFKTVFKTRETEGVEAANKKWGDLAEQLSKDATTPTAPKTGFQDGEISGGQRSGNDLAQTTETQVVDAAQTSETTAVDAVAAQNRAVRNINEPLLDDSEIRSIINQVKDNPEFLSEGQVRPNANYNYDRLLTDDGAKLALDQVAEQVTPILDAAHRSYKSFESIRSTAEFFGANPEQLLVDLQSAYKNTKQIEATLVAGRSLVAGLSQKAAKLAREVERDSSLYPELEKTLQQAANVDKLVRGVRSSTARATASGNINVLANLTPAEIKALQVASPEQFLKIVQGKSGLERVVSAHNEFWINALLSGPRTHIRNIVSNAIQMVALPSERMIGGLLRGDMEQIRAGAATFMGLRSAVLDSIKLASKASGLTDAAISIKNPSKILDVARKTGDSILDPKNAKLNGDTRAITGQNFGATGRTATVMDAFGELTRIPGRFLTAEDEFFKQLNYRAKVYADATQEALNQGLKGADIAKYIESRTNNAFSGAGNATDESALAYARRATFTSVPEPGSIMHSVEQFAGTHPAMRMLIPFIRTPTNILKEAALRTPVLSVMSKKYRAALSGDLGPEARAQAYGQFASGSMLWTAGLTLALEGNITGRGPADPREKQVLLDTGWRPYSFKVGGTYVSFDGFDPTSTFFGVAGDFADCWGHLDDPTRKNVIGSMLTAVATNITSKTYLQGLTQVMEALTQPEKQGEAFLKSRVSSYVPAGLKQLVGLIPGAEDPYMRETRTVLDAVMNKLPGFSKDLPPRRNIFGEAVTATKALGPDSISPFYYSEQKDDKAANELARFSHAFSPPSQTSDGVDLTLFKNPKGQDFYDRWQEQLSTMKVGRYTLKERLDHLVTSDAYQKWKANESGVVADGVEPRTLKEVRAVIEEYRQRAKQKTLGEYPEVADLLRAQKKVQVRASAGAAVPDPLQNIINQLIPNK